MLFNSIPFLGFLILVLAVYWLVLRRSLRLQNYWLLLASYVFYGAWDWRFLGLIAVSTLLDFWVGKQLFSTDNSTHRKRWLWLSIGFNLGVLALFKYYNFFIDSLQTLLHNSGWQTDFTTLQIILPVGISFYTFQTLSYTIDIYRKQLKPITQLADFALYVSFFPQLVAGPIERATRLLPQIQRVRIFDLNQIYIGSYLLLWGLFKKVVIADNLALIVNPIFADPSQYAGLDLGIAVLAFSFQIYGDFSGYTDMARGVAKWLGFDLMLNFNLPYFAKNPSDFWRRWHISLSTWLRDYLYIPLGGNRNGTFSTYRNLLITMLLGGLWHGAAWNFVLWGAYHGALLAIHRAWSRQVQKQTDWLNFQRVVPLKSRLRFSKSFFSISLMFLCTLYGWLLFRAGSFAQIQYFTTNFNFTPSEFSFKYLHQLLFFVVPLFLMQIWQWRSGDLLIILKQKSWIVSLWCAFLITWLLVFGVREQTEFIYFQF